MYRRFSDLVLRWARVRPEPDPPLGAPGSERTFRAGKNYYYLRLLGWGAAQIGAAVGLTFSVGFVTSLDSAVRTMVLLRTRPAVAATPSPGTTVPSLEASPVAPPDAVESASPAASPAKVGSDLGGVDNSNGAKEMLLAIDPPRTESGGAKSGTTEAGTTAAAATADVDPSPSSSRRSRSRRNLDGLARIVQTMPHFVYWSLTTWVVPFVFFLEYLGIAIFLALIPATHALARIEYEQHWYIVTDRSLRIRTGVLSLSESTMSFANIQQVELKQGPLQRLLGLADIRVQSAGGGSSGEHGGDALHTGVFRSVDNAHEIRDLIVARLRAFREAGLGDPDPESKTAVVAAEGSRAPEVLEAAHEVLSTARALRAAAARDISQLRLRGSAPADDGVNSRGAL